MGQDKTYGVPPGTNQVIGDLCRTAKKHNEILLNMLELGVFPSSNEAGLAQAKMDLEWIKTMFEVQD